MQKDVNYQKCTSKFVKLHFSCFTWPLTTDLTEDHSKTKYNSEKYFQCRQVGKRDTRVMPNTMRCAIWYHLYNSKNVKNTHGGVLILEKLQTEACNFTKINNPPLVFFTFLKLYKWYQIAQRIICYPSKIRQVQTSL